MTLDFSFFELYIIFVGMFAWPISLLLGAGLLVLAFWKARRWQPRVALVVSALVLLFPVAVVTSFAVPQWVQSWQRDRNQERHAWKLEAAHRMDGFTIPADSTLQLDGSFDMTRKNSATLADVERIYLSKPARLLGARLTGIVTWQGDYWKAQLADKQVVDGWPCVGQIGITPDGKVLECRLTRSKAAFGYVFPPGTHVDLSGDYYFEFWIPDRGTELRFDRDTRELTGGWADDHFIRSLWKVPPKINRMAVDFEAHEWTLEHDRNVSGTVVPAGSTLELFAAFDMRHKEEVTWRAVSVAHLSAPAVVHGARLQGTVFHYPEYWKGRLASPQTVDGWFCKGIVHVTDKGRVRRCTLARASVVHGYRLPAGMTLHRTLPRVESFTFPGDGSLLFDSETGQLLEGETQGGRYFEAGDIPPEIAAMHVDVTP